MMATLNGSQTEIRGTRFFKRKGVIFDITFVFDIIIMDRFGFQQ